MKRLLGAAVTLSLAACGGGAPAGPDPPPPLPFALPAGAYTLLIYSPPGVTCFAVTGGSATAPNPTVSADALLSRDGVEWVLRAADEAAGTLVVRLSPSGSLVQGRAVGTVISSTGTVVVPLDHPFSGAQSGTGAHGALSGNVVTFVSPSGAASTVCGSAAWTLTRR